MLITNLPIWKTYAQFSLATLLCNLENILIKINVIFHLLVELVGHDYIYHDKRGGEYMGEVVTFNFIRQHISRAD
jgi:hypothetical protein